MNVKPWLQDHLSINNTRNSKSIQSQAYNQQKSRQQTKLANLTQGPKTAQQHLEPIQHKAAFSKGEEKKNFRYDMNFNKQLTKIENKYFKNNEEKEAGRAGSSLGLQNVSNQYLNQNAHKRQGLDYKSAQYNSLNILNKNSQTSLIQLPALNQQPVQSVSQMQNDHNDSQLLQNKIDEILIQNPNYLLHQHNICKQDNKERLKDINNLKDLVNFKVKTVADKLIEKNQRQLQQIESIPIDNDFYKNRLEAIKLSQIQTQSSINTIKNICDPILANRGFPELLSKQGLNPLRTKKQFESKQNMFASKILDIQSQSQIIEEVEDKYEIPQNLKQIPKNYNLIFANSQFNDFLKKQQTNDSQNEDQQKDIGNDLLVRNDSFEKVKQQYENQQKGLLDESIKLKQYHQIQFQDQQKKLEESIKKIQIDPVKLLKSYFQNKKKDKNVLQTKDLQKSNQENDLFQNSSMQQSEQASSNGFRNDHFESKMTNKRETKEEPLLVGAVHENYVISKYQKKLRTGKLEKEIEHNYNELQILENIQRQLKQTHLNQIYNVINDTSSIDKNKKNQGDSMKELSNQIKTLGPQKVQMLTQLLQEFVQQDKQNQSVEKENKEHSIQIEKHNYSKLEPVEIPKVNYEQFINESKLELQQNLTSQEQSQQNINTSSIEDQNSLQNNISSVKQMRRELINIFEDSLNPKSTRTKKSQVKNFKDQSELIENIDKIIKNSNVQDSGSINNENLGIELSQILNLNEENQSSPLKQISQNKLAVENLLKQIKGELSFSEIRKQKVYIEDIVEDRSAYKDQSKTQNDQRGIFNYNDSYNDYQTQAGSINIEKSKIIGKSGLVHSELLKYSCAKYYHKNQNDKKIDKLKKYQKKEANSVKNQKANQNEKSQLTNSLPQGSIPVQNMSQELSQLMYNEQSFDLTAKNSLFINQSQDVAFKIDKSFENYTLNNSLKLNINGSLPQIKQQLDKKQFSILLLNDQSNLKNENFQFLLNDLNIQPQNQEAVLDKNVYEQKFHDKQTSFNHQQSQDSSILNVNLHYEIPNSIEKENKVLYIGKSQTEQQMNSIRSQYGTMKGSQQEKEGEYDSAMRVSGVKLSQTAQNQISKIRNQERIQNLKQIQQAVQKQDKNVSPLRTLNELEYSTPNQQDFTILRVQKELIEEDENSYNNQIDNQNLYRQYYDQNIEVKNPNITQILKDSEKDSPGYQYGENHIMNKSNEQFAKNQIKKPFSLTKSSRVSIFSNQQNKTFSNNFKKSEDLMVKQNSGKIKSSKSSQARSENHVRMQNVKETIDTQKQQILQSQTQFNQTYQNFKDIEGFKQKKNNNWKKNDEETDKSHSMHSGMIKGKMNLSAMMTENRLHTKNHDLADSAEKIKSEAGNFNQNQQIIKYQDTLINETINKDMSANKQLQQREQFIQNTLIQIENSRNRQIDQNIDLLQQNQAHTQTKFEKNLQIKPKNYECQFNENPLSQKQKKLEFKNQKQKDEKGYHSSNEPYMDQASSELYDQILKDHFVQKGCWIPSRFKMFPRFAIFTNKNKQALDDSSTNHHEQYISLSSNVLALLAGLNANDQQENISYLQPPAVTNQSINVRQVNPNSFNTSVILTPRNQVLKVNERLDTDGTAHLEQSYREKIDMQVQKGSGLNYNLNQSKLDDQASATFESGLRNDEQVKMIRIQQSSGHQQNDYLENKLGTVRLNNNNQLQQAANHMQLGEGAGQSTTILNDYTSFDKPQSTFKNMKFRNSHDDLSSARNINGTNHQSVMDVLINNEINLQSSINQNNKFTINQTINYSSIDLEKNQSINNQNKIYVQNNASQYNQDQQRASQIQKGEEAIKTQKYSEQVSNPDLSNLQALLDEQKQSLIIKHFDPFDKVVLSKGMDNQILTSYRTILKSNNMLSNTLKVIHQRFLAKQLNKSLINRLPRGKHLYPISMEILQKFAQEMLIQDELEKMNDTQRRDLINNLEQLNLLSQHYDMDKIDIGSFYIENQSSPNQNIQQLNIIRIDNLPQPQNSFEFNVNQNVNDQSQINSHHRKNIISGQSVIMKNIVNQMKQNGNEDKNSSSNPQDESKLEIDSKNAINNIQQDNSIVEADTREIEDEKSQTFSKIKADQLNSIKQLSNVQYENHKSTLANKTLVSNITQSNENSFIIKQNKEVSQDNHDQDQGSDKIKELQRNKKTTVNHNSQAQRVNYLFQKQDDQNVKQKAQKKQIIKKIEGKIAKKRENLHIPMYDMSTGIVVRQEQSEFYKSNSFIKGAKFSSSNQTNMLTLTQQIAQAILAQRNQNNSPIDKFQLESWKMNQFNLDPQFSITNQKQIQQNNSLYSSILDEDFQKIEGRNDSKILNKYNTDQMNSKKQKDEILLRLEENLSSQNNYYGNAALINQKQVIQFSSIKMSSHHLNQSEQAIHSQKEDAASMKNIQKDYKQINVYDQKQQSLLQGALNINFRIPVEQQESSSIYMVTPGRSLFGNQVNKQNSLKNNMSLRSQNQKGFQEYTKTEQVRLSHQGQSLEQKKDNIIQGTVNLNSQHLDQLKSYGQSRNSNNRNSLSFNQGNNTEMLSKTRANLDADSKTFHDYGKDQHKMNIEDSMQQYQYNRIRQEDSPYASEDKPLSYKKPKTLQNLKYVDFDNADSKINLIVLDNQNTQSNNADDQKISIPFVPAIKNDKDHQLNSNKQNGQNKDYQEQKNMKNLIDQLSEDKSQLKSFNKSFYKMNEVQQYKKSNNVSKGSQDYKTPNHTLKNNQDLQHAVSFLNESKKQSERSNPSKDQVNPIINLQKIGNSNQLTEQKGKDTQLISNRDIMTSFIGGQANSTHMFSQIEKSKDSYFDHSYERNLQSKFALIQNDNLQNSDFQAGQQLLTKIKQNILDKNQTKTDKNNVKQNENNKKNQKQFQKKKNTNFGGGYNSFANQSKIEEQKQLIQQAYQIKNQQQTKPNEQKVKNEQVGILMSVIQQTSSQNLDQIQKVLLNIVEKIKQQESVETEEKQEDQKLVMPETIQINSTLFSQSPRLGETISFKHLNLEQTIEQQPSNKKVVEQVGQSQLQKLSQLIVSQPNKPDGKQQIKQLIDDLYTSQKRYHKKINDRRDLINTCDFVFDLNKAKGIIQQQSHQKEQDVQLQIDHFKINHKR